MKTWTKQDQSKAGAILGVMLVVLLTVSMLILSLFKLGQNSRREALYEKKRVQAFWIADAGVRHCVSSLYAGEKAEVSHEAFGGGSYSVKATDGNHSVYEVEGTVDMGGQPVSRRIQINLTYAAKSFDDAIYGANRDGDEGGSKIWSFVLGGKRYNNTDGPRVPSSRGNLPGGNDVIIGNVNVNGGIRMYGESTVQSLNGQYEIPGDVLCSQGLYASSDTRIKGVTDATLASSYIVPNLIDMNYAKNNSYDLESIFSSVGYSRSTGRLMDASHPLYNVVVKNVHPSRVDPTPNDGDDYYFQPVRQSTAGGVASAGSVLMLGDDKVFYVNGHVWFHGTSSYGFKIDGTATIVSTKDIHISDNLVYANNTRTSVADNKPDMLALVALGGGLNMVSGEPSSGGNIYFGDPAYGTLFTADAFMFANNNFYYNTYATGGGSGLQGEPETGLKVFGNFMAMNQVVVKRDWYTRSVYEYRGQKRVVEYVLGGSGNGNGNGNGRGNAYGKDKGDGEGYWYDVLTGKVVNSSKVSVLVRAAERLKDSDGDWVWRDSEDGTLLTASQINDIRHYAMQVEYDDRIRDIAIQMLGLPQGSGSVISGYTWKEI